MIHEHWSDDQLIARAYGVGAEPSHLETCPECRARWNSISGRRSQLPMRVIVSEGELAANRAGILNRIKRPRQATSPLRAAAALAGISAMALGLSFWQNQRSAELRQEVTSTSDTQLFADAYAALEREPRAVTPVKALFETRQ